MRHDTKFAEACRLSRHAVKCRALGDEDRARRLEAKALEMVGDIHDRQITEWSKRAKRCIAAAMAGLALWCSPGVAEAAPKKPTVCVAYEVIEHKGKVLGVCHDGKRPKLYASWKMVDVADPETGAETRYMVGF